MTMVPNRRGRSLSNLPIFVVVTSYALGQGIIIPAIPLYAYSLRASETMLGLLGTLPAVTYAVLAMKFGELSEKKGRRIFIILGTLLYLAISFAYLVLWDLNQILAVRSLEGVSLALFWPCAEACIADMYGGIYRRRAIGYYTLAWSTGTTLGPALGGYLMKEASIKGPFAACTVMMLISLLLSLAFIGVERKQEKSRQPSTTGRTTPLRSILCAILGYAFAQATVFSLYPVHGILIGFTEIEIGIFISLIGLSRTIIFAICTFWNVGSEAKMAMVGYLTLSLSLGLMPTLNRFYISAISFVMMGIGLGLVYVSIINLAMNHQRRGVATGAFESGIGIGGIAGPIISGIAAEHIGFLAPYWLSGFFALVEVVVAKKAHGDDSVTAAH